MSEANLIRVEGTERTFNRLKVLFVLLLPLAMSLMAIPPATWPMRRGSTSNSAPMVSPRETNPGYPASAAPRLPTPTRATRHRWWDPSARPIC